MTDAERLAAMADAARAILTEADLMGPWDVFCATVILEASVWPLRGGQAVWSITVCPPKFVDGYAIKARLKFVGEFTPLALRVLTALNDLMWDERRTEGAS